MSGLHEWRQPPPEQLACEQDLERLLKACIQGMRRGKRLEPPADTACTELVDKIVPLFVQAEALGRHFASKQGTVQTQESLKDWFKRASDLVERVIDWARQLFVSKTEQLGDDSPANEWAQALNDTADTVAETLAPTEIQAVIEQTVLDALQDQDVGQVVWVVSPGACEVCQKNASMGPIGIGQVWPSGHTAPPGHFRCRCHLQRV